MRIAALAHGVGYRERKGHWMGKEYVKDQRTACVHAFCTEEEEEGAQQRQHQEKGQDKVKEIIIYFVSRQQMTEHIYSRQEGACCPFCRR